MSMHLFFEFLNAAVGTMAFALLFQVPKQYYVNCGIIGGCGWLCYKLLLSDLKNCRCNCTWYFVCF